MENTTKNDAAIDLVISTLVGGEQTEAYIFAEGDVRGLARHQVNAAIAELIAAGRIVETTIRTPPAPWGHGDVDALRAA